MKWTSKIFIILVLSLSVSCREKSSFFWGDTRVASVGGQNLFLDEIRRALPAGLSQTDSVSFAEAYTEKWILNELKLQEAEKVFSSSEEDIERMVTEYRKTLLVQKIDQYFISSSRNITISDEEIEEYYRLHKGEFTLSSPIVKGEILQIPDKYARKDRLLQLMSSDKEEARKDFEALCDKNNFTRNVFAEWVDFSEFITYLPLANQSKHDNLLLKKGVQKINQNNTLFCFMITDVLKAGEPKPLFMVRDNISRILEKRSKEEIIRSSEQELLNNATAAGRVRKFELNK